MSSTGALSVVLIVAVLVLAVVVGEVVRRRRSGGPDDVHGGPGLGLFVDGALTLAVVTCAFMLAVSYSAYNAANRDAGAEAGTVAGLYEAASLLPQRADARQLQQDTICYGRAVVSDEWPRLGDSDDVSPLAEGWRDQLRADLFDAAKHDDGSALGAVRDANIARTTARQTRLVTSRQHAPDYLFALLLLISAVAVVLTAAFTIRGIPALLRRTVLGVLVSLLGLTLAVIFTLDHPFDGLQQIGPDDLALVSTHNSDDYLHSWGEEVTACDIAGRPA